MMQTDGSDQDTARIWTVGDGIASLAAAAFMIRDGNILGHNITIFEELDTIGGSLDASDSAEPGYVLRGGRMFESKIPLHVRAVWFHPDTGWRRDRFAANTDVEQHDEAGVKSALRA